MSLKVLSINIEGNKHFERWLPVVAAEAPDVLCIQEVFEADMPMIVAQLGFTMSHFAPTIKISTENKYKIAQRGLWGVGYCTNLLNSGVVEQYYAGSRSVKEFVRPEDNAHVLLKATVEKEGCSFTVATTHFTWTPNGSDSPEQHADFAALKSLLGLELDCILCGDFNAPRGGAIYSKFASILSDCVPPTVTTTIDPELHYAGALELVVDAFFASSQYAVEDFRVLAGVSDHKSLVASFRRI